MTESRIWPTQAKRLLWFFAAPPSRLVAWSDDRYIAVLGEAFRHDRGGLDQLIERVPCRSVMVEIGSGAGFATRFFTRYFERVITVDPYRAGYDTDDLSADRRRMATARDLFTIRFIDDPRVVQYREPSGSAATRFQDGGLDFVYIDGCHLLADVGADIRAWRPKVRRGGCIGGDDLDFPGVRAAVDAHFATWDEIAGRWLAPAD